MPPTVLALNEAYGICDAPPLAVHPHDLSPSPPAQADPGFIRAIRLARGRQHRPSDPIAHSHTGAERTDRLRQPKQWAGTFPWLTGPSEHSSG